MLAVRVASILAAAVGFDMSNLTTSIAGAFFVQRGLIRMRDDLLFKKAFSLSFHLDGLCEIFGVH